MFTTRTLNRDAKEAAERAERTRQEEEKLAAAKARADAR